MQEPLPPPRPDLQPPTGPLLGTRRIRPWVTAGAVLGALALIGLVGSLVIDRSRKAKTTSATSEPTASDAPSPPGSKPTPSQTSPFATLEVRRAGGSGTAPEGWIRWRASDGSFSFDYPRGTEPRDPTFEDGLWELDSRGSAVHLYIYVTDRYSIGPSPMSFLERIADGLTDGQTELRRSRVVRHRLTGLDLEYLDIDDDYRFFVRLYAEEGLLYQVTAGYSELLDDRELRLRAVSFLDSFRVHDRTVTGGS